MLKVYCDTNTLAPNIRNDPSELAALERLRELHRAGKISMVRSRVMEGEADRTRNTEQRERLRADYELLDKVLKNERLLGSHTVYDHVGGFVTYPLMADIQDENLLGEIFAELKRRVPTATLDVPSIRGDMQNLTQAICNECDVFLTRDYETIIKPLSQWLEQQHHLRVCRPSELAAEIERNC